MPSNTQKSLFHGTDFASANRFLGDRDSVMIANHTWLKRDRVSSVHTGERSISVQLHSIYVVTYWLGGYVSIDTGGFNTPVTARRIGQFSPVTVSLKPVNASTYYVSTDSSGIWRSFNQTLVIDPSGDVVTVDGHHVYVKKVGA